ncbi:Conserved_hypothetical protein [Hexamita inflata]|uniref:DUF4485 domain-containing protein n=1 Tax=Hexamita inflata TaxID=28002 RepID=A0AA86RA52_9EUKA|nr:Conserved hypothetical protein [Hexamita inflata]
MYKHIDQSYLDIYETYQQAKLALPGTMRYFSDVWFNKLSEHMVNGQFKLLRNIHALALLDMVYKKFIQDPFLRKPDEGPFQNVLISFQKLFYQNLCLEDIVKRNAFHANKQASSAYQKMVNQTNSKMPKTDQKNFEELILTDLKQIQGKKEPETAVLKKRIQQLEEMVQKMKEGEEMLLKKIVQLTK